MTDPIVKTITVSCTPARAFEIFAARMEAWWPLDSHSVSAGAGHRTRSVAVEPKVGGRVIETMFDGWQSDWGVVLDYVPGARLSMSWHPGTAPEHATRVDVVFEPLEDGTTRVTLTHSGWDALDDQGQTRRRSYDGGWETVLGEHFGSACQTLAA